MILKIREMRIKNLISILNTRQNSNDLVFGKFMVLLTVILFVGCRASYDQAVNGGIYSHMQTPVANKDKNVVKNYISAKYNKDVEYYPNENNISGELSYHIGGATKYLNYAFGGFVYGGEYKVRNWGGNLSYINKDYLFYGGGIRAKIAFNKVFGESVSWRIFGIQAAWSLERGDFHKFKRDLIDLSWYEEGDLVKYAIGGMNDFSNISFFPYTELAIRLNDDFQLGCSAGVGCKLNRILSYRSFATASISYKKFYFWLTSQDVAVSIDRLVNNDFLYTKVGNSSNFQLGVGVCF